MEDVKIRETAEVKTLNAVVEETTRTYICEVLEKTSGNVAAAADALGLSRQGLYKKMKRLGIDWTEGSVGSA